MNNPSQAKTQLKESADVSAVVQEYMDSLLVDLFPDVESEPTDPQVEVKAVEAQTEVIQEKTVQTQPKTVPVSEKLDVKAVAAAPVEKIVETSLESVTPQQTAVKPAADITQSIEDRLKQKLAEEEAKAQQDQSAKVIEEPQLEIQPKPEVKPEALRYPNAPVWAQQAFDVLLFDVCGLKLAVPMESLGKIIKVDHETNHLIGRPSWFIGAYNENEQNLYVVDTAQYIMPEKGFDLARDGFEFIIQLQRSQWTLACKKVYNTVRLEPDQVKWRSQQGKRQWLSGTVIDHMCALIHVDSLIDLLQAEAS